MKVICYGDSNTFGYDPRGYFGGRYDHGVLAERLGIRFADAGQGMLHCPTTAYT